MANAAKSTLTVGGSVTSPVLRVSALRKVYKRRGDRSGSLLVAVNDVSFEIGRGETFALVGETGCGKTSIANAVLYLDPPTSGTVEMFGEDVGSMTRRQMVALRRRAQMVAQDPYSSLDSRMRVGAIVEEPLRIHDRAASKEERERRVADALEKVGLDRTAIEKWPHQFSGGQRQRIAIARAIVLEPSLVVCDEPTSALDVSIQAQVLNLLMDLQESDGLAFLFISHNLSVVRQVAHRVAVIYLGRIIETGLTDEVLSHPRHPYTRALVDAVPTGERSERRPLKASGSTSLRANGEGGCPYFDRCEVHRPERCATELPQLDENQVACHFPLVQEEDYVC